MRWGQYNLAKTKEMALLHFVLHSVIVDEISVTTCMNPRFGAAFDRLFRPNGGWLGDPLSEIYNIPEPGSLGRFQVYASDEISGIGLEHGNYAGDEVVELTTQMLKAYGKEYPKEQGIIDIILARIPAYRERLKS